MLPLAVLSLYSLPKINVRDLPVDVSTTAMYEGDANVLSETTSASAETHVTLRQVLLDRFVNTGVASPASWTFSSLGLEVLRYTLKNFVLVIHRPRNRQ